MPETEVYILLIAKGEKQVPLECSSPPLNVDFQIRSDESHLKN